MAFCKRLKYIIAMKALQILCYFHLNFLCAIPYFCFKSNIIEVIILQQNHQTNKIKVFHKKQKVTKTWNLQCFHSYFILKVFAESHLVNQSPMKPIKIKNKIYVCQDGTRGSQVPL